MTQGSSHALRGAELTLTLALVPLACGGRSAVAPFAVHGDSSAIFGSGTRLKARYLDGGGGAKLLLRFHDTELDLECRFMETSPGVYGCLPAQSTVAFSDAACSQPLLPLSEQCPTLPGQTAGTLISASGADCAAMTGAFSLLDKSTQDGDFQATASGECLPSLATAKTFQAWTTQPEPLAQFARGTLSVIGAPGGTQVERVSSEDGAFVNTELVADHQRCTLSQEQGVGHCLPGAFAQRSYARSADAACSNPNVADAWLSVAQECAGIDAHYSIELRISGCEVQADVSELGPRLPGVYAWDETGTCQPKSDDSTRGRAFFEIGARVSTDAFPIYHPATLGDGNLRLAVLADREGSPLQYRSDMSVNGPWSMPDGTSCYPSKDVNGQLRCMSGWMLGLNFFGYSDPECTQVVYNGDVQCQPAPKYIIASESGSCSSPRFERAYRAERYTGTIYANRDGACSPEGPNEIAPGSFHVIAGAEVSPDVFPLIVDTTDP